MKILIVLFFIIWSSWAYKGYDDTYQKYPKSLPKNGKKFWGAMLILQLIFFIILIYLYL